MADDYDDVSTFVLSERRERALLDAQTECVLMWTTDSSAPVGVVMNFVVDGGHFWLTATRRRKRIAAIEARPRVAVAVTSRGTDLGISQSLTYQGTATIHEDHDTARWFYPALAARVRPESADQQAAFVRRLDTPGRVIIEVAPGRRIGFDSEAMFLHSDAGPSRTRL